MSEGHEIGDPGPSTMESRGLAVPPKVSQIDSDDLDEALVSMLCERVQRSLANFRTSLDLKPELNLALKLVIFQWGIWDPLSRSSPGASLQNLRLANGSKRGSYGPTRRKLLLYLLLHPPIFPSYILTRLRNYGLSKQWPDLPARDYRRKLWRGILAVESFAKMWELAGWTAFLIDPRYPSLLMRILQLRLVPATPHLVRLVSYEYMNRQLVWSAFTEFLLFAIPKLPRLPASLSPSTILANLRALVIRPQTIDYTSIPLLEAKGNGTIRPSRNAHSGPFADLPMTSCPICHQRRKATPAPIGEGTAASEIALPPVDISGGEEEERIFIAAQTDCWGGCRWCYYCIAGELARHAEGVAVAEETRRDKGGKPGSEGNGHQPESWSCLRCGGGVSRAWRVGAEDPPDGQDGVGSEAEESDSSSVVIV